MNAINPILARACQLAAAMVEQEVRVRRRLNPNFNPEEIWASVTHDARIHVGTPLLRKRQGFYVNYRGEHWEV